MSFQNLPRVLSNIRLCNETKITEERKYQCERFYFLWGVELFLSG